MKRLLLLLLLIPSLAFSVGITEHYVTTTGTDTYANSTNPATPCSLTTAIGAAVAGDRVNIKSGTYTRTGSDTVTNAGTIASPIIWRGYATTITDGYQGRSPVNGALVTTNMPTIAYNATFGMTSTAFNVWDSIVFTGSITGAPLAMGSSNGTVVQNCSLTNSSTNVNAAALTMGTSTGQVVFNNDIIDAGASGVSSAMSVGATASSRIIGNHITGGPGQGIRITGAANAFIAFNVFLPTTTGDYIITTSVSAVTTVLYNTFPGGAADGIHYVTSSTALQFVYGNMGTDNTGDFLDMVSTGNGAWVGFNRTRDNGSAIANGGDWITATNYFPVTTDTGGPETDYVSAGTPNFNYNLIWSSPALITGWPLYHDIGALQAATPTPTPTATFTPTPTSTPTATPTATATASATNTPTPTATPSSTPTPVINNVIYGQ